MSSHLPFVNVDLSGEDAVGAARSLSAVLPVMSPRLVTQTGPSPFRCRLIGDAHVQAGSVHLESGWEADVHRTGGYLMLWAPGPGLTLEFSHETLECPPAVPIMMAVDEVRMVRSIHPTVNVIRFDEQYLESVAGNHLTLPIGPLRFTRHPESDDMTRLHAVIQAAAPVLLSVRSHSEARHALGKKLAVAALGAFRAQNGPADVSVDRLGVLVRGQSFIDSHLTRPLTLADIASAVGVSARELQVAFHRHGDTTPMNYLRQARLFRVRADIRGLQPGQDSAIASIAARWGFAHYGQFRNAYAAEFGEQPMPPREAKDPVDMQA